MYIPWIWSKFYSGASLLFNLTWEVPMQWEWWTPEQLFLWAKENLNGAIMYYVTEEDIISHERKYDLKVRYNEVQTAPGTHSYHCFIPDGDSLIMKRISNDTTNDVHKFNDPKLPKNPTTYQPGKYNACCYLKIWYIGDVLECSNENQNVKVKFMTGKGLNLQWVNDTWSSQCWVPFTKVLREISLPLSKRAKCSRLFLQWRIITRFYFIHSNNWRKKIMTSF